MSLIRTDYVSEWRISAHAQSVLAAGQKQHKILILLVHYGEIDPYWGMATHPIPATKLLEINHHPIAKSNH